MSRFLLYGLLALAAVAQAALTDPYALRQVDTTLLRQRLQHLPSRRLTARAQVPSPIYCPGAGSLFDTDTRLCVCPINSRSSLSAGVLNCVACPSGSTVSSNRGTCVCTGNAVYKSAYNTCTACTGSTIAENGACVDTQFLKCPIVANVPSIQISFHTDTDELYCDYNPVMFCRYNKYTGLRALTAASTCPDAVVKISYASNTTNCYTTCPATNTAGQALKLTTIGEDGNTYCHYNTIGGIICGYKTNTGVKFGPAANCPALVKTFCRTA